ncbi:MAG: proton-conducting transporter membrane subunit [Hyphomonadaceae bacterium]
MSAELALAGVIAAPLLQALLVIVLSRPPGLRDVTHFAGAAVTALCAVLLLNATAQGEVARIAVARPLPNVELAFALEPLGALAAMVIGGLGLLHALHTAGMVRAAKEKAPARLMAFIALTTAASMAAAFSANLFTFFVAYQALILASFPLVAHRGDEEARKSARTYLAVLLAASIGLLLPAMVWTYAIAGPHEFRAGGVLGGRVDAMTANALLTLYVLGLAMTAIPPLHRWLPASSNAPFPAIVTIQALAVLPIGGVGILKVAAFEFGAALNEAVIAGRALLVVVGVGMCGAALIALSKRDVRERLAYSVMGQSLAVVMGALLASPIGFFAAALQVVAVACAASTLLMAAGTTPGGDWPRNAPDYAGLGRVMPWTFAGFALASASMIGMPPFSGAWAKLWLLTAAASVDLVWAAGLPASPRC